MLGWVLLLSGVAIIGNVGARVLIFSNLLSYLTQIDLTTFPRLLDRWLLWLTLVAQSNTSIWGGIIRKSLIILLVHAFKSVELTSSACTQRAIRTRNILSISKTTLKFQLPLLLLLTPSQILTNLANCFIQNNQEYDEDECELYNENQRWHRLVLSIFFVIYFF